MFFVYCSRPSKSASVLAKALRGRRLRCSPSYVNDTVINWGDSSCPIPNCLNQPEALAKAANKLTSFRALRQANVLVPNFATQKASVNWKGTTVVRHKLTGHSGEGIEICEPQQTLPEAPLYVEYIKKEQEFRIHVGRKDGETKIIAVQRKARNKSIPDGSVNWKIRNHDNGFVFVREGVHPHDTVLEAACHALVALGLDFGAVDIIWNAKENKAYVLEINTAPGLEGQTIDDYATFFRS